MKHIILIALLSFISWSSATAQKSRLQQQGTATQLIVDGKPFLILGGELGNVSGRY